MSIIKNLANHSAHWQMYDQKFRQAGANEPLPWGKIHTETYLFCSIAQTHGNFRASPYSRPTSSGTRTVPANIRFRKGYCWDFQRLDACPKPNCSRLHQYADCDMKNHGVFQSFCPQTSRRLKQIPSHFLLQVKEISPYPPQSQLPV